MEPTGMHVEELMIIDRELRNSFSATAGRPSQPFPGAGQQRSVPIQGTGTDPPLRTDIDFINEYCDGCYLVEILAENGMINSNMTSWATPTASPQFNVNPPAFQVATANGDMVVRKTLGTPML